MPTHRTVDDAYREMSEQRADEIMREVGDVPRALALRIARLEIEVERINDSRSLRG
jgi:hypothetical protein